MEILLHGEENELKLAAFIILFSSLALAIDVKPKLPDYESDPGYPSRLVPVSLAWDPSPDTNVTYAIYCGASSGNHHLRFAVGTNLNARLTLDPGLWFFVCVAVADGVVESLPSNEVSTTLRSRGKKRILTDSQ